MKEFRFYTGCMERTNSLGFFGPNCLFFLCNWYGRVGLRFLIRNSNRFTVPDFFLSATYLSPFISGVGGLALFILLVLYSATSSYFP